MVASMDERDRVRSTMDRVPPLRRSEWLRCEDRGREYGGRDPLRTAMHPLLLLKLVECRENFFTVSGRLHAGEDAHEVALRIDEERIARRELFPVVVHRRIVGRGCHGLGIGEQL